MAFNPLSFLRNQAQGITAGVTEGVKAVSSRVGGDILRTGKTAISAATAFPKVLIQDIQQGRRVPGGILGPRIEGQSPFSLANLLGTSFPGQIAKETGQAAIEAGIGTITGTAKGLGTIGQRLPGDIANIGRTAFEAAAGTITGTGKGLFNIATGGVAPLAPQLSPQQLFIQQQQEELGTRETEAAARQQQIEAASQQVLGGGGGITTFGGGLQIFPQAFASPFRAAGGLFGFGVPTFQQLRDEETTELGRIERGLQFVGGPLAQAGGLVQQGLQRFAETPFAQDVAASPVGRAVSAIDRARQTATEAIVRRGTAPIATAPGLLRAGGDVLAAGGATGLRAFVGGETGQRLGQFAEGRVADATRELALITERFTPLKPAQQEVIDVLDDELGRTDKKPNVVDVPIDISDVDFDEAPKTFTSTDLTQDETAQATLSEIRNRQSSVFEMVNQRDTNIQQNAEEAATRNAINQYLGANGSLFTDGQGNAFALQPDGSTVPLSPEQLARSGRDVSTLTTFTELQSQIGGLIQQGKSNLTNSDGDLLVQEDFLPEAPEGDPVSKAIDALQGRIQDLEADIDFDRVQNLRAEIAREEGLGDLKSKRRKVEDTINTILQVYEELAEDVRTNPNFSKQKAANRLGFLDKNFRLQIKPLQNQLQLLNGQIADTSETVNNRYRDELNALELRISERDKLFKQISSIVEAQGDIAENAQDILGEITSNPELYKGITQQEIRSISQTGSLPESLVNKVISNAQSIPDLGNVTTTKIGNSLVMTGIDRRTGQPFVQTLIGDISGTGGGGLVSPTILAFADRVENDETFELQNVPGEKLRSDVATFIFNRNLRAEARDAVSVGSKLVLSSQLGQRVELTDDEIRLLVFDSFDGNVPLDDVIRKFQESPMTNIDRAILISQEIYTQGTDVTPTETGPTSGAFLFNAFNSIFR